MMTFPDVLEEPLTPCPACGASDWKYAGQVKDYSVSGEWFELRECSVCHLMMTLPSPNETEIGRYYASQDYISHSDTRKGIVHKLYHAARTYMMKKKYNWVLGASGKKTGTLLDVGAGTGHFAHYMKSRGWTVTALEPDAGARKVAAEKFGLEIRPLEDLALQPSASFDVVTLWHVLEHVHDLSGYLDHFRSILRPEGVLIIAVPNHTSRDAKQYGAKWAAYDAPRHLWHFSPESMEKLLSRHKFDILNRIPMPLDAFYVSLLSEKYEENDVFGLPAALISGIRTFLASCKDIFSASSLLYIAR